MAKVLVTGGAGFIGSHTVEALVAQSYEVAVVDNFSSGKMGNITSLPVEIYNHDVTDPKIVELISAIKPDTIIHLAAQVSVAQSVKDMVFDEKVNVTGSLHIMKAAINCGVKRLVFASSAAVYGTPSWLPITEKHLTDPSSPYGLTKRTVEHYLEMASKLYGISYSILRYSNVYGPRQDAHGEGGVVSIFADRFQSNTAPIIYGDGEQTRDFIYVKDLAQANVKACDIDENIKVNISSEASISVNELFGKMKKISHSKLEPIYQPARTGDIRHSLLANKQATEKLSWQPVVSLEEGLVATMYGTEKSVLEKVK